MFFKIQVSIFEVSTSSHHHPLCIGYSHFRAHESFHLPLVGTLAHREISEQAVKVSWLHRTLLIRKTVLCAGPAGRVYWLLGRCVHETGLQGLPMMSPRECSLFPSTWITLLLLVLTAEH